jgi:glycosyltransferase involved in cell wall biosynthesis
MHVLISGVSRNTTPTGLCRYTANLIASFTQTPRAPKVSLVLAPWQVGYFRELFRLDDACVQVVEAKISNNLPSRYGWPVWGLPEVAESLNPDLIHLAFPTAFVKAQFRVPVVTTIHDLYAYDQPNAIGYPNIFLNRLVLKAAIRNSDALISISETTKQSLAFHFPSEVTGKPSPVIYQPIAFTGCSQYRESKEPPRATSGSFLLAIAGHRRHKNLHIIIEAFKMLLRQGDLDSKCRLIIVGSPGMETSHLLRLAGSSSGIEFLSALSDAEMISLYKNCELYVSASANEGFCLPVAEALTLACRVVCSDIPVFREVAAEGCTYFSLEVDPVTNLVNACRKALRSSKPSVGSSRFLQSHCGAQCLDIYTRCIDEDRSRLYLRAS